MMSTRKEEPENKEPEDKLEDHDANDEESVLGKFMAFSSQFDKNEFRVDQSDRPNEPLRLYARPIKSDRQDPRRSPRFQSRLSLLKVMERLPEDGFVTTEHWGYFQSE